MRRIVVAGARGFFGSTVLRLIRAAGAEASAASRRTGAHVVLDVEDRASIRHVLRSADVVVDATAPFQARTSALIEEAIAIGFDVIDLCDSLEYARSVAAFDRAAHARGIRIFNCCSAVSVLSALAVDHSRVSNPAAVHAFLAPATRQTGNRGVVASFLSSVGQPIEIWRDGRWKTARGWTQARDFTSISRRGRLIESADALTLPRAFPTLKDVDFWVDPNTRGAALPLAVAARIPSIVPLLAGVVRYAGSVARFAGRAEGCLAYEIEPCITGGAGLEPMQRSTAVIFNGADSFAMAAIPAAVSAVWLADAAGSASGVVPVNSQIPHQVLLDALHQQGIGISSCAV